MRKNYLNKKKKTRQHKIKIADLLDPLLKGIFSWKNVV